MGLKTIFNTIIKCTFIGATVIACTSNQQNNSTDRPNIIFIMADDHATQAISCYGSKLNQTPNIDKLASQGILFRNAFVTNSICAPSRAVTLTGKFSHLNGVTDNHVRFDSAKMTFPKIFQKEGYETSIVGKWHLKSEPTGFDYWNVLPGQGNYYNPDFIELGKDTTYHGYVTEITTDIALNWLSNRETGKPFMLMLHHKAPHRNWMPNIKSINKYEHTEFPHPVSFYDDYTGREHLKNQKLTVAHHLDIRYDLKVPCDSCPVDDVNAWVKNYDILTRLDEKQRKGWNSGYEEMISKYFSSDMSEDELINWNFQRYMQDYLSCILSIDESMGRIMQYLEENGLDNNTVVVYTSDQGFFLGEHGLFDKRYMYEESLRTPLIIKYPAMIKRGIERSELVQNLDIAPTLLNIAGIIMPESMQGRSLNPLFERPENIKWREAIYYQFYETGWGVPQHYGLRTNKYKLIHFINEQNSWELYDLEEDPYEMNNIYHDTAQRNNIEELKIKLKDLQSNYNVPKTVY